MMRRVALILLPSPNVAAVGLVVSVIGFEPAQELGNDCVLAIMHKSLRKPNIETYCEHLAMIYYSCMEAVLNALHNVFSVFVFRSEEHTSELQSLMRISYAVFCLKKQKHKQTQKKTT